MRHWRTVPLLVMLCCRIGLFEKPSHHIVKKLIVGRLGPPHGFEYRRMSVGPVEPPLGNVAVDGLREVYAVPAHVRRRVGARGHPRHPAHGAAVPVVGAAGAAARLQDVTDHHPCTHARRSQHELFHTKLKL
jgi:hypothetical protein